MSEGIDSAAALARTSLFAGLGRIELAKLAAQLEELRFGPGEVIVAEDEPGDAFYIVKSGLADVVVDAVRINQMGPGDGFGEMALLTDAPRTATVVAASALVVWRLSAAQFRPQFERDSTMAFQIARQMADRLASQSHEFAHLVDLASRTAPPPDGGARHAWAPAAQSAARPPVHVEHAVEPRPRAVAAPAAPTRGEGARSHGAQSEVTDTPMSASKRRVGAVAALLIAVAAVLAPPPPGLDRAAMLALGAVFSLVPLLVVGLLLDYAAGLALVGLLVVSGTVPPAVALGGFASPSWLMVLALFAIAAAVGRSGLLYRLALIAVGRLPANFGAQSLAVALTGLAVSMGVTNGTSRAALAGPAVRAMAEALRLPPRGAGAASLGLVAFVTFVETNALFATSSSSVLLLQALLPEPYLSRHTWGAWLVAGLAANAVFLVLSLGAIVLLLRPPLRVAVDPENVRLQRRLLGPITPIEVSCLAGLAALLIGFVSQAYHGISPAWVALGVCVLLALVGALDQDAFRFGISWGTTIYLGALIGLGDVFTRLGIDAWLAAAVAGPLAGAVRDPYIFVLAVGLTAVALHLVVPLATASPLLVLVTMPLAVAAGFSPLVPAVVAILAGDHMVLPHVSTHYRALQAATEGALFDDRQARPLLWLSPLFRLVAVVASVPYWQASGLM